MSTRLPTPGGDNGDWGDILNAYLDVSHNSDGTLANSTVGTNQLQNNAVTNAQLDSPTQSAITLANSSVQSVNSITPTSGNVAITAGSINAVATSQLGAASGVATLDSGSHLTAAQLPTSVVNASAAAAGLTSVSNGANGYNWEAAGGIVCAAPTGVAATDNANFQAGLTAAAGGTLVLLPGTYNLTAAPTIASFTRVLGDKSTILQCNVTGNMFDLTGLNGVRFEGISFTVQGTSMTLFNCSGTFNCSWANVLVEGTHSVGSPQPGEIGWSFTGNSGDNFITDGSEIGSLGIAVETASYANYMSDTKVSSCQYGLQSLTGGAAGMVINNCVFASANTGVTLSQLNLNTTGNKYLISNSDFEGSATATVVVGTGVLNGGPTLFSMVNCTLEGSTKILDIESAYGCILVGLSFTAGAGTPTSLTINSTGAPSNGFAMGLVTNVAADSGQILSSVFPSAWVYLGKTTSLVQGISGFAPTPNVQVFTTSTTISSLLSTGAAITSLPVVATSSAWSSGATVVVASGTNTQVWTLSSATASGVTSIPVNSQIPNFAYPIGSVITLLASAAGTATWTKPAGGTITRVLALAPGGGGGAGARGPTSTARVGGGGGGGGGTTNRDFVTSDLSGTVTVTLAGAGSPGAAQGTDGTAGANGTAGGSTHQFGAYVRAFSGGLGTGGGLVGAGGGAGAGGAGLFPGLAGGAGSATGAAGAAGATGAMGAGGGAGGGISAGNTDNPGGTGSPVTGGGGLAGTAGAASGNPGGNGGASPPNSDSPGGGAGGGAGSSIGAGGAGGNGGNWGAGGGGGGASLNGNASGAGGYGAGGIIVVITQ